MDIQGTKNDGESVHNPDNDNQKALSDMQSSKNESGAIQNSDNHDQPLVRQFQDKPRLVRFTSDSVIRAVRNGDGDAVRRMLREGANPNVQTSDGQTALNISIQNQDMDMMHFLLEQGANTELANREGERALYLASKFGTLNFVELLLQYGANCESFNETTNRTAFHQAVEKGHIDVAKTLLDAGADIDAMISDGQTVLFSAVRRGDEDAVNFLLQNGANKKIRDGEGHIHLAEDFASGGTRVMDLLQSDPLIQGPSSVDPKPIPKARFVAPSLPAGQGNKTYACRGFEGTIIDFFIGETEQRIQKTVSIYEMLYGKGPEAIMNAAKGKELEDRKRDLRWYHLPANNVGYCSLNTHHTTVLYSDRILDGMG
jgi:ankyrin repeat protein